MLSVYRFVTTKSVEKLSIVRNGIKYYESYILKYIYRNCVEPPFGRISLIQKYWGFCIGPFHLFELLEYGEGVILKIANKINEQYPTLNRFSKRGLYHIIQFYEIYKDNQKVQALIAQLSWSNNVLIIQEKMILIKLINKYSRIDMMCVFYTKRGGPEQL